MEELIDRVQDQLKNNWAVDAEDIERLVVYAELSEQWKKQSDDWYNLMTEWKEIALKELRRKG